MKYKVGDKVRRISDSINEMPIGTIVTVSSIDETNESFNVEEKEYSYCSEFWCFKNFELVKEEPVEDIIEYKGKKYDVINEGIRVDNDKYKHLFIKEHKEEILDEEEKEYLRNVIKYVIEPAHKEVKSISKQPSNAYNTHYISISYRTDDYLLLPDFKDNRMYKGMESCKEYTLEQLGL